MEFRLGAYYKHESGHTIHIIGLLDTHSYGVCWVAEDGSGHLRPVGRGLGHAEGWIECPIDA